MLVKITSNRQVTLPAHVLEAMGVGPGDYLEVSAASEGLLLRPRRIDFSKLAPLAEKIPAGHPDFDISAFRESTYDPALRD